MGRWQPDAEARLRQAALALFSERGYEATTIADIAERAGLTKRTFFRYFPDKREVLFRGSELLERHMAAAIEAASEPASALGLAGAALDAAGERFEEVREFAVQRQRVIASSPELRERELRKAASLAETIARSLRSRGLDETDATLVSQLAVTAMHIAFQRWVADPDRASFQSVATEVLARLQALTSSR